MVFHWSLRDSKSPQVSRTLLSILTVLNNVVVWMVSFALPTSKSSSPFNNPLVTVPKAPITISIIVTFMFHTFFNSLARSRYLSYFSLSFNFIVVSRYSKIHNFASSLFSFSFSFFFFFFFVDYSMTKIRWSVCTSKSRWCFCVSFSRTGAYHYYYYYLLIRIFRIIIIIIIIIYSLELFTSALADGFFKWVWVTASLLKSPGLFLVFWPFSTMLSFGWSPLVRQLPSPLVPLAIL